MQVRVALGQATQNENALAMPGTSSIYVCVCEHGIRDEGKQQLDGHCGGVTIAGEIVCPTISEHPYGSKIAGHQIH